MYSDKQRNKQENDKCIHKDKKAHSFSVGAVGVPHAFFGEGVTHIFFDNVQCNGTESTLLECSHQGLGVHDCQHSEDTGVVCPGMSD